MLRFARLLVVLGGIATALFCALASWSLMFGYSDDDTAMGAVFAGLAGMLLAGTIALRRTLAWGAALVGVGMAANFVVFLIFADLGDLLVLLYLLAVGAALVAAVAIGMARAENA